MRLVSTHLQSNRPEKKSLEMKMLRETKVKWEYRENLKDILNIWLWWGLERGNTGVGDRWDFKRKMKMGEEQTKDTCDIE